MLYFWATCASTEIRKKQYSGCLQWESNCLVSTRPITALCVCLLHCIRVHLHYGYMWVYVQIMQHTHMHKAVTGALKPKGYSLIKDNGIIVTRQDDHMMYCYFQREHPRSSALGYWILHSEWVYHLLSHWNYRMSLAMAPSQLLISNHTLKQGRCDSTTN